MQLPLQGKVRWGWSKTCCSKFCGWRKACLFLDCSRMSLSGFFTSRRFPSEFIMVGFIGRESLPRLLYLPRCSSIAWDPSLFIQQNFMRVMTCVPWCMFFLCCWHFLVQQSIFKAPLSIPNALFQGLKVTGERKPPQGLAGLMETVCLASKDFLRFDSETSFIPTMQWRKKDDRRKKVVQCLFVFVSKEKKTDQENFQARFNPVSSLAICLENWFLQAVSFEARIRLVF